MVENKLQHELYTVAIQKILPLIIGGSYFGLRTGRICDWT